MMILEHACKKFNYHDCENSLVYVVTIIHMMHKIIIMVVV